MEKFGVELVGKIGSMALIDKAKKEIDLVRFKRLAKELRPGIVWVSSGATEIGRLDYIKRTGGELTNGNLDENKADYASQGQTILMQMYRQYIDSRYGVRQLLVEHQHFNDAAKREHIRGLLLRAAQQNAVPVINYNDPVSFEENRKLEIQNLRNTAKTGVVELVDNDETAAQIACLLRAETLLILTGVNGIYRDASDPSTLIERIGGASAEELINNIDEAKRSCVGASRAGANGAGAKLEYIKTPAAEGTKVIIANAAFGIKEILSGSVPCTVIKMG